MKEYIIYFNINFGADCYQCNSIRISAISERNAIIKLRNEYPNAEVVEIYEAELPF